MPSKNVLTASKVSMHSLDGWDQKLIGQKK